MENPTEEESQELHNTGGGAPTHLSDDLVFVNTTYLNEPMHKFETLSLSDDELGKVNNPSHYRKDKIWMRRMRPNKRDCRG